MVEPETRGETSEPRGGGGRILTILRWVAFGACVLLFAHALAKADLAAAWERVRAIGPLVFLVLVPFPFAMAVDAWAWQGLLAAIGRKVPLFTLVKVRLATEAVTNSAPAGAVWADALGPILVSRRTGFPTEDVFAAVTAKRWTVVRMHSAYVALAAAFGAGSLLRASRHLVGSDVLLTAVFGASAVLMFLSIGIQQIAAHGRIAERVSGFVGGTRLLRVKAWIEMRRHRFARADGQLKRISQNTRAGAAAARKMLLLWIIEGLETWLILHLLGAPLGIVEVMSFDAALSVVRSTAMFAPAGIGVQDVGYLTVLEAYGVPDAGSIGPAFIVLKRVKEAVWIAIGFVLLARAGPREVIKEAEAEVVASRSSRPPSAGERRP